MADWTQLPKELLHLIWEHLDSTLYRIRFRSVCSSWRSSCSPIPTYHPFPIEFPIVDPNNNNEDPSTFSVSKCTLLLITPPHQPQQQPQQQQQQTLQPWLIKIRHDPDGGIALYHPLARFPFPTEHPTFNFHQLLDLYELPVIDLGHQFFLRVHKLTVTSCSKIFYMGKMVFASLGSTFVLLTIQYSGVISLFRFGDERWTKIPFDMRKPKDICVFKGRLFVVDKTGRTVVVGSDLSLGLVADPVFGGDNKFLVHSEGELLLVDKFVEYCNVHDDYDSDDVDVDVDVDDDGDDDDDDDNISEPWWPRSVRFDDYDYDSDDVDVDDDDNIPEPWWPRSVRFDVYRFDEKGRKWAQLRSLGDRVLFVGGDCAFSASVSDLRVDKGNCVIFRDDDSFDIDEPESGMGVFDLDEGRIFPLSDYPGFSKLFWPPPDWIKLEHWW